MLSKRDRKKERYRKRPRKVSSEIVRRLRERRAERWNAMTPEEREEHIRVTTELQERFRREDEIEEKKKRWKNIKRPRIIKLFYVEQKKQKKRKIQTN